MIRVSAALAAALLCAGAAVAEEAPGPYLGAGFGEFSLEIDDIEDVDIDFDRDDDAFKLFGGWRFNRWFAAELDYIDFGRPAATIDGFDIEADASGVAPYAVGTLPLGDMFEIFGKLGIIFYDVDISASDGIDSFRVDDSGEDIAYGGGLGLTLFDHLTARLEYEVVDISDFDNAEAVWLTGAWRF